MVKLNEYHYDMYFFITCVLNNEITILIAWIFALLTRHIVNREKTVQAGNRTQVTGTAQQLSTN